MKCLKHSQHQSWFLVGVRTGMSISTGGRSASPCSLNPCTGLWYTRRILLVDEEDDRVLESGILTSAFHFMSGKLVCCLSCCPLRCGSQERNCGPDGAT